MVKISTFPNGVHSQRVEFWWAGEQHKGPNRKTREEVNADKARLETAPNEDLPGIIAAMKAEKKKAEQEAKAQKKAEEEKKETEHLLSKLHVRQHTGGSYRVIFYYDNRHYGPLRSRSG